MDEVKYNKLLRVMKQISAPSPEDGTFVRSVEWIEKIATDCLADLNKFCVQETGYNQCMDKQHVGLDESRYDQSLNGNTYHDDLEIPLYDASLFHWIGNSGVADCSDLGVKVGCVPFDQLHDDEDRLGLILYNPKTGTSKVFCYVNTFTYSDSTDVTGWVLKDIENKFEITIVNS
jgi:hypothetical protein